MVDKLIRWLIYALALVLPFGGVALLGWKSARFLASRRKATQKAPVSPPARGWGYGLPGQTETLRRAQESARERARELDDELEAFEVRPAPAAGRPGDGGPAPARDLEVLGVGDHAPRD